MKGLRPALRDGNSARTARLFLPLDLIEGITTPIAPTGLLEDADHFYLWTWLKGLRLVGYCGTYGPLGKLFLPLDLIEGITTRLSASTCAGVGSKDFYLWTWLKGLRHRIARSISRATLSYFYLWTWLKGLRLSHDLADIKFFSILFLPLDLIEGITTQGWSRGSCGIGSHFYLWTWLKGLRLNFPPRLRAWNRCIFTFGPDWRDYDSMFYSFLPDNRFLPLDLIEGITTFTPFSRITGRSPKFLPLDLIEGITTRSWWIPWPEGTAVFLPLDLIEGITT